MRVFSRVLTFAIVLSLLGPNLAFAQIPPGDLTIRLELVAEGLAAPVTGTHAGDGSGRLFIVDQAGFIRILQDGVLLDEPFLDLSAEIVAVNPNFDERGLLGLAFHPDYATNGRFFVRYSKPREGAPDEPCASSSRGCHEEVLAEYGVSDDPNVANPAGTILFRVDEPQFNHDGGHVAFGPDGYLYFSLGDGGGAHDGLADEPPSHGPIGNGQDVFTPLGAILRIDVDGDAPFGVPADNPFVGLPGNDLIYAYGLRNPYRFSFDDGDDDDDDGDDDDDDGDRFHSGSLAGETARMTSGPLHLADLMTPTELAVNGQHADDGDDDDDDAATARLLLADVGQNLYEEVNIIEKGGNYGWVIREGFHCFDPFNPQDPPETCSDVGPNGEPLLDPIAEYGHDDGLAVIGGYVYRGRRFPQLRGKYVFGDFSRSFFPGNGRLFYLDADGDTSQIFEFRLAGMDEGLGLYLFGLAEDEAGELYALTSQNLGPSGDTGKVFHIARPFGAVARPCVDTTHPAHAAVSTGNASDVGLPCRGNGTGD